LDRINGSIENLKIFKNNFAFSLALSGGIMFRDGIASINSFEISA